MDLKKGNILGNEVIPKSKVENFNKIRHLMKHYNKEYLKYTLINQSKDKNGIEENVEIKKLAIYKPNQWIGTTAPSKTKYRLFRIKAKNFISHQILINKDNDSINYQQLLYAHNHFYKKYADICSLVYFILPITMLVKIKGLASFGYVKFLPLVPLFAFYNVFREQAGNIGVAKNSIYLLFVIENLINEEQNPSFYNDYKEFMNANKVHFEKRKI